jgi:hypothetical protein
MAGAIRRGRKIEEVDAVTLASYLNDAIVFSLSQIE